MRGPLLFALLGLAAAGLVAGTLLAGGAGLGVRPGSAPAGAEANEGPFAGSATDIEDRLERLEARVGALAARLDILLVGGEGATSAPAVDSGAPAVPGASLVAGGAGAGAPTGGDAAIDAAAAAADDRSPGSRIDHLQEELARLEDGASARTPEELRADLRRIQERLRATRDEAELQRRLDTASEAMNLESSERDRLETLLRDHRREVDELGDRARSFRRDSGFGLSSTDKSVLQQLQGDRKALDARTFNAVEALVGPDRWKQFKRAEKLQRAKDRTLRSIANPW